MLAAAAAVFYLVMGLVGVGAITLQGLTPKLVIFGEGGALLRDAAVGALAGLAVVGLTRLAWGLDAVRKLNDEMRTILGDPGTSAITVLAVTSAIGEELLFRGALQPMLGFVPTAVIFGLLHGGFQAKFRLWAVFALLAGLLLGALTLWTDNLLAALLCHMTVNYFNLHKMVEADTRGAR
jgi:membrane protease YdiL (CAAX protease family)